MNDLDAVTELVLETFRLNGQLLAAGDALVAKVGLTSARWQVLGAIALSAAPLPVAHIARNMGLTRQARAAPGERNGTRRICPLQVQPAPSTIQARYAHRAWEGGLCRGTMMTKSRGPKRGLADGLTDRQIATATAVLRAIRTPVSLDRRENWKMPCSRVFTQSRE